MAVTFIPFNFRWVQVAEPQWTVDGWGCDKAKVTWRGPRTGKKAFEDSLVKFSNMPATTASYGLTPAGPYPMMYLNDWASVNTSSSFPSVELNYIGFRSGTIPPVKGVDSVSSQTANGEGTDSSTGDKVTGTIQYRASRTTWTWFTTSLPPDQAQYNTVENAQNPFANIDSYHIQVATTGEQVNSVPYSAFVAIFNSLLPQEIVSNYEREPLVPNALYACRSDVDFKLVS